MARNWKVGEAVQAIKSGNKEDILDIGRRFPLFTTLAVQLNDAGVQIANAVPDYVSARKIESVLKGDVQESDETDGDEGSEEVEEKPAKPAKAKEEKVAKPSKPAKEKDEYADKTPKELFEICKKAGLKVATKQPKEVYIKALKDAEAKAAKAAKAAKEEDDEDDWGDEEEEKPAKPAKSKSKAKAEEDDDEDWNI